MRALRHAGVPLMLIALAALPLRAAPPDAGGAPAAASTPKALRQYRDAVAFQNRAVYDLAADEWQQFLEDFPRDPLVSKARHYLGVCRLQLKQFDEAEKAFAEVI